MSKTVKNIIMRDYKSRIASETGEFPNEQIDERYAETDREGVSLLRA
jgi:hypothetical protein